MATIGVLTGGGDCPGLNAVIRGIVLRASRLGHQIVGIRRGWKGLLEGGPIMQIEPDDVEDIQLTGGTILGTSRRDPLKEPNGKQLVIQNLRKLKIDALIAIGGDETLSIAAEFSRSKVPLVGVPKTLDNNVSMTDLTFGFVTASNIACEAIERLSTSAQSRERVIVVEVLGRQSGWTALFAGLAAGAEFILVPEFPFNVDDICRKIRERKKNGKEYSIVVVSEGAQPDGARRRRELHKFTTVLSKSAATSGVSAWLAEQIEQKTKIETQSVVLGHVLRGGSPTTFDRVIGMRLGAKAVDLVHQKKFGAMAALQGTELTSVPLAKAVKVKKQITRALFEELKTFFD